MASLFTYKFVVASVAIATVYVVVTIYLMNYSLVTSTILGDFPLGYKEKLLLALLGGMWTAMTRQALSLLVITSLLTGANVTLLVSRLRDLKNQGKVRIVIGGSSLLGMIGSGCAACGLPILALLGLGGSVAYLPLGGMELSYLSALLLMFSFFILVRSSLNQSCTVSPQKPLL
ncbi:MAG: hypothetical protein ABI758_05640 [Candidatus Woesebacteria bacterium]